MNILIVSCLLIASVVAVPQGFISGSGGARFGTSRSAVPSRFGSGRSIAAPTLGITGNPYGPKAYGPGLNNPYTLPPNPFKIQKALALANQHQGVLVRINVNGEVDLTDQFGKEVDHIYDRFGNDLADIYDF